MTKVKCRRNDETESSKRMHVRTVSRFVIPAPHSHFRISFP